MDKTTRILAEYVTGLTFDQLSANAQHETKRRLIDTIGCGIGGYSSEPSAIAIKMAAENTGKPAARVLGSGTVTSIEMAAFANTVMIRYLDCNTLIYPKAPGIRAT